MILIISTSQIEESTNEVVEWLRFYNAAFMRFNGDAFDPYSGNISFEINNSRKKLSSEQRFDAVKVIWFRRWGYSVPQTNYVLNANAELSALVRSDLQEEYNIMQDYFFKTLHNKKWLNHPADLYRVNKLNVLSVAVQAGLAVPSTLITGSRAKLAEFYNANRKKIICKNIGDTSTYSMNGANMQVFTHLLTLDEINALPEKFFPCTFQKAIDKVYEIRAFYLAGKFYAMAIFSQADAATKTDFRNYNAQKPNRNVPYRLRSSTAGKLKILFKNCGFDSGCADLIRGKDGHDYFLEINPLGQFGVISDTCRYQLEKVVARHLIRLNGNN